MYRSSLLTHFCRFILTPLSLMVLWIFSYLHRFVPDSVIDSITKNYPLVVFYWIELWWIVLMLRLKRVEVNFEHIIIKSIFGKKIVSYENITGVYQMRISPSLMIIEYKYNTSKRLKKLIFIPESTSLPVFSLGFKEWPVTRFILDRMSENNAQLSDTVLLKKWIPIGRIFVFGLIILLLMHTFSKS